MKSRSDPKAAVDAALRLLGIAPRPLLTSTTRRIFGCRLMAGLLGARMLQRDYLHAQMGFCDTLGYGGGVREELQSFTGIFSENKGKTSASMRDAADCWLLFAGEGQTVRGALRMDGVLSSVAAPETGHNLFASYKQTKSMRSVVVEAQNILFPAAD